MNQANELKPCQCGMVPIFVRVKTPPHADDMWRCFCLECQKQTMAKFTKAGAAKVWNRREGA